MDNGLDEFVKMIFDFSKNNPNEFRNYFSYIKDIDELNIPDTVVVPISEDFIKYVCLEEYSEDFSNYIIDYLNKNNFDTDRDLFIKDGKFSNKFNFETSFLPKGKIDDIGEHAFDILYGDMCLCDFPSTDIIVREFIHTSYKRPSIYSGLKLNTEFRVFYDFDNHEIMDIFNYWDYDTMVNNLKNKYIGDKYISDKDTFEEVGLEIEKDYLRLKKELIKIVNDIFPYIELNGEYSADFLWDGNKFRLIDMALGRQSYYYDKIKRKV